MEITIKIKVKNVEIELTTQEARDLAEALRALTGQPQVVVPYVTPWWWPMSPTWPTPWWTLTTVGGTSNETIPWHDPGGSVTTYRVSDSVSVAVS